MKSKILFTFFSMFVLFSHYNDESGNGYNGSLVGTVPFITDRNGNSNSAIQGGTGYLPTSNQFFRFSRTDSFTVSVWFTVPTNSCSGRLLSTESPEGHFRIANYGGGQIVVQFGDYLSPSPVTTDQWHHLVYVYDNRNEYVYIDGELNMTEYELEMSEVLVYNTPFTIGAKAASSYDKWCGNIDDVGIWNRPLSSQEVSQLYYGNTPPTDVSLSNSTIDENSIIGTEVGTFTSIDIDNGDTHTYTLVSGTGDTDNSSFTISGDKLLSSEVFDFETKSSYSIRVQTDDGKGGTFSKSFDVSINDLNEYIIPNYLPENGLVAWYPFNGNANDENGNENDGIVNGSTLTLDRNGNLNSSYSFNQSYILVPNSSDFIMNNYTISIWVKTVSSQYQVPIVKLTHEDATNEQFGIALNQINQKSLQFAVKYNNPNCSPSIGWLRNESNQNFIDGQYHHIVGTVNGNLTSLYFDGVLVNSIQSTYNQSSSCFGGDIQIGRNWINDLGYFDGDIDDIGIWNRPLSSMEVSQLYSGSTLGTNKFVESKNEIKLYPNPTDDVLTIDSKIPLTKVEIFSILGKKVDEVNSDYKTISTDNLSSGMYILKIHSEKGFTDKKLIKN